MIPFREGLDLAEILDMPSGDGRDGGPGKGPFPLVILLHGFTGWKEEEHLSTLATALNVAGIGALRYDAPGSGESQGSFMDDYRLSNYVASVDAAIAYAQTLPNVDARRLGIWGHSMGGFVALANALNFKAVCGSQPSHGGGHTSSAERAEWEDAGRATFSNRRFPKIELPYAFYEDRQKYNVMTFAGDLTPPLLLIAGTRDRDVSAQSVREICDAAPPPKRYEEFNTNHFYKLAPAMLRRINDVTVEFFRENL